MKPHLAGQGPVLSNFVCLNLSEVHSHRNKEKLLLPYAHVNYRMEELIGSLLYQLLIFSEIYQNIETLIPTLNWINYWVQKESGSRSTDRPGARSTSVISFGKTTRNE